MGKIVLKARAKINLSLDILGKRPDGYHDVKMIMQTVDLCDNVFINTINAGIKIKCNIGYVPVDNRNVVYKVAEYMLEKYSVKSGVYINLVKQIPVASGLGGGSSDAAATIVGLNNLFNLKISNSELIKIGEKFGADIPFCIVTGTALAEGIGEKITYLKDFPKTTVLICKPQEHISTGYVYKNLNLDNITKRPDTDFLIKCIEEKDIKSLAENMVNVLETITIPQVPAINTIKDILLENGAYGAMMSGSGTSVFGIFENKHIANEAAKKLGELVTEIFVTETFNKKLK